jgi:hypothetical protein
MKTNGNDPANPTIGWELTSHGDPVSITDQYGLTKREYFAAIAMQGLLADTKDILYPIIQVAKDAVNYADALIEELNKND